jgi:ABC-type nitrate/sulfonate/bicarbonate transport system permease component
MGDADLSAAPAAASRLAVAASDRFAVAGAVLLAILFWEGLVLASEGWVPSTVGIVVALVDRLLQLNTYAAIGISLGRIAAAFAGSFLIGVAVGFAMGLWHWVDAFWRPIVAIALAIPDPVYFIMAILILGPGESVSLLALTLAVLPFAVGVVAGNVRARDYRLDDMAQTYRITGWPYARHVLIPQMAPAIVVAARTAFAFSWKIGVLMEALMRPDGVGAEIFFAFRLFKAAEMIALAVIFIAVMRGIEILLFVPLERRAAAWRN